ncbi:MAG: hypothetical protein JXP48_14460 [Acidobacteria bacterium]|nr:hypothetical protein [Acidobacteriota bacterium]
MNRILLHAAGALALALAFSANAPGQERGPLLNLGFSGSSMDPAWVFRLDPSAGYRFNSHFEVEAGLPVYFVHAPSDDLELTGAGGGVGNAWVGVRGMVRRSGVYFSSGIRAAAPTGDVDRGLSTGRVTVDWSNYVDVALGDWNPFGRAGIANTVSDTHFFTRPFSSLGLVGHFEGGLGWHPVSWAGVGASGYAVVPSGEQKIYSRLVERPGTGSGSGPGAVTGMVSLMAVGGSGGSDAGNGTTAGDGGAGGGSTAGAGASRPFETESVIIGESDLARDHGFSGWVDFYPGSNVMLEIGYSRSVSYDSNSLFFSVNLDLMGMMRKSRP